MSFGRRKFGPGPPTIPLPAGADPSGTPAEFERLAPRVGDAATNMVDFLLATYRNGGGVNAETVIGGRRR